MNILSLVGRNTNLLSDDIAQNESVLSEIVNESKFLVIGGAGSIGQEVVKEIFKRSPKVLHVVDISENNLVELVRDVRSSLGYIPGDFQTLPLDCGSYQFDAFVDNSDGYDYVLNLSAMKHVRSEKDPFSLMRLIEVNILNTNNTIEQAIKFKARKYFCVSTDKAANPVNMMGASKRIMELFLAKYSSQINVSTARFANVAFSDGSLLHGFNQRIQKRQPLAAPQDIKRYFVTPQESGELCLLSCLLGENMDIFFPKLINELHQITFSEIAIKYLVALGYEPYICQSEDEARAKCEELIPLKKWPCYFFNSDTTGEKDFEEFYTGDEELDMDRFKNMGIVKNSLQYNEEMLRTFLDRINELKMRGTWNKIDLVQLFNSMLPGFNHLETGKYLDGRM